MVKMWRCKFHTGMYEVTAMLGVTLRVPTHPLLMLSTSTGTNSVTIVAVAAIPFCW